MTDNTKISVTLTPELRLEQALKEAGVKDPTTVTKLSIAGTPTIDDFEYIRKNMCENLQVLDMSNASITKIESFNFYGCKGLTSVILPDTIVGSVTYNFENCTKLSKLIIFLRL